MTEKEYSRIKALCLDRYFCRLNPVQREAVYTINGPLLILAGAGSGKTTVLVNRVANMVYFGNAYSDNTGYDSLADGDEAFLRAYASQESDDSDRLRSIIARDCVKPWNILAITFTNKAAGELRERLDRMLQGAAQGIVAATFHSACVRILRREISVLGYTGSFTIYDTDDSVRLIKDCMKELNISDKMLPPRSVLSEISSAKESSCGVDEYARLSADDYRRQLIAKIYSLYQKRLFESNSVDFDDIILLTVRLFEENPDILQHYRRLYKYILVDEYQDTNTIQYRLCSLLSSENGNICVVGDDDQSIYKFRGATIENILSFEKRYKNAVVIRLEQNYRSTQNILTSANEVIKNNRGRKGKRLWTDLGDGERVTVFSAEDERSEARMVVERILESVRSGGRYSDNAVLYRMNAQSNAIEQALIAGGVSAYRVYGGVKFYDRKEVKDIIAYLSVINNGSDSVRLKRIINEPKRGIGQQSVELLERISQSLGESMLEVMRTSAELPMLQRASSRMTEFYSMIEALREKSELLPLPELLDELLEDSGYLDMLKSQGDEGSQRLENINELKSTMAKYAENESEPSLSGFLEEISLYTDIDEMNPEDDAVSLMTIHSAKGLEFNNVFVVGMEENIFPSSRSLSEADIEEERRLCYVAITRARRRLTLSHAGKRMLFGNTSFNPPSRFLGELPRECITKAGEEPAVRSREASGGGSGTAGFRAAMSGLKDKRVSQQTQEFSVGERVGHNIFGEGTVLSVMKMSGDLLLEIAFDRIGTKRIMANFARLKKL